MIHGFSDTSNAVNKSFRPTTLTLVPFYQIWNLDPYFKIFFPKRKCLGCVTSLGGIIDSQTANCY